MLPISDLLGRSRKAADAAQPGGVGCLLFHHDLFSCLLSWSGFWFLDLLLFQTWDNRTTWQDSSLHRSFDLRSFHHQTSWLPLYGHEISDASLRSRFRHGCFSSSISFDVVSIEAYDGQIQHNGRDLGQVSGRKAHSDQFLRRQYRSHHQGRHHARKELIGGPIDFGFDQTSRLSRNCKIMGCGSEEPCNDSLQGRSACYQTLRRDALLGNRGEDGPFLRRLEEEKAKGYF